MRIGFLLDALKDINILAAGIGNTYYAKSSGKVYTTAGPAFGA
jgi:hypothetical protein